MFTFEEKTFLKKLYCSIFWYETFVNKVFKKSSITAKGLYTLKYPDKIFTTIERDLNLLGTSLISSFINSYIPKSVFDKMFVIGFFYIHVHYGILVR